MIGQPLDVSIERLLRELTPQALGTVVRRFRDFAAAAGRRSRGVACRGDTVATRDPAEIAHAFLVPEPTMAQRTSRARQTGVGIPMADKKIAKPVTAISLTAARLSITAVITYQVILIALIFIRPDLDPSWHTISEWAIGPHGWIMSMAFLISAVSYGSLFVAIKSQVQGIWGNIGLGILFICFIGTVGVGVFTTDPYPPEKTLSTTGILHTISGGSAMMLLPFAALLINLNLARKNKAWATARRALLWTAGLPLLAFVGSVVHLAIFVIPMGDYYGPGLQIGWPPRFLFLTYMVWLITLAWEAIKVRSGVSLSSIRET